jgi:hypothetical protein
LPILERESYYLLEQSDPFHYLLLDPLTLQPTNASLRATVVLQAAACYHTPTRTAGSNIEYRCCVEFGKEI